MAKFTPGPTIAEIRGSIGGTVFSRNHYTAYTRNRVVPVVSTTSPAMLAKARLSAATVAWQNLTQAQRNAWLAFALSNPVSNSLGQQQALTGHAAFVGHHIRALIIAATPLDEPPVVPAPESLTTLALTSDIGLGGIEIAFTPTPTAATELLIIRAAIVSSAGIRYVKNLYRIVSISGAAEASPFDFQTALQAVLGLPVVGQTLHVSVTVVDNVSHNESGPLIDSAVTVTT